MLARYYDYAQRGIVLPREMREFNAVHLAGQVDVGN
jgi:hypothetical protein